jgi:hypothetical protein
VTARDRCPTCGAERPGAYCAACGEKRIAADDYSVVGFATHAFESLTNFDLKSLRAFTALVFAPGSLTREYLAGRRRRYIGPVQLFAIVNIIFFIGSGLVGMRAFNTPFRVQQTNPPFAAMKRTQIEAAITRRGIAREDFARRFDDAADIQAKSWVFLLIPMTAAVLSALYGFRRYAFEHLVFSTHFWAFTLLWMITARLPYDAAVFALTRSIGITLTDSERDFYGSMVLLVGLLAYCVTALRTAFADSRFGASLRAVALTLLIYPLIQLYRFVLFFVTMWTMS